MILLIPPKERLRTMLRAFFHSECEEAPLRSALDAATPDYHDAPEAQTQRARSRRIALAFVAETAPQASPQQRSFAADLLFLTTTAVGKQVSERHPPTADVDRWADAVAEMLLLYLERLAPRPRSASRRRVAREAQG
jgi:hypothetical protein